MKLKNAGISKENQQRSKIISSDYQYQLRLEEDRNTLNEKKRREKKGFNVVRFASYKKEVAN